MPPVAVDQEVLPGIRMACRTVRAFTVRRLRSRAVAAIALLRARDTEAFRAPLRVANPKVRAAEWMARLTVLLPRVLRTRADPAEDVFLPRDGLEMCGIDAGPIPAQMIELDTNRKCSAQFLV